MMLEKFKKLKKYEKVLILVFIFAQTILFFLSHLKFLFTPYLNYTSIVLCFVFSLFYAKKSISNLLISIALLFTICADFVLTFTPEYKIVAMLFFCLVQAIYFLYIFKQTSITQQKINLWLRIIIIFICEMVLFAIFKNIFNLLAMLVIFYFINLLFNTVFAFVNFKKNPLFAIGLILFVLCDIFVGLGEISLFFDVSSSAFFNFISSIPFDIAWTFYAPSQVLIALGIINSQNIKYTKQS